MPIYKVTTEGDCEGRTIRDLGYVEANSPEHAIKHLESVGKHAYYQYWIDLVETPIVQAKCESELQHLVAEVNQACSYMWSGTVKTD